MSVTAAEGFVASGCHAGIKKRRFDMAMFATEDRRPVPCAAVFTQNKFAAPPVELGRATLRQRRPSLGGRRHSGNANAGTGRDGCATRASWPLPRLTFTGVNVRMSSFAPPASSARRFPWTRS